MLETIRTLAKTWIAKTILALILIPFALFGLESYIRGPGADTIANVAGDKISSQEFDNALKNQIDQLRQRFGSQIDASVMDNPEIRKGVLDQLIDQRLLDKTTKKTGIVVSDATLREQITTNPAFFENGEFSPALYERVLKAQGFSVAGFESQARRDVERQRFLESVNTTSFVADASVMTYLSASEQSREVSVVFIQPQAFLPKINITAEQAQAFYEKNKAEFTVPEQVRAEYVELSVDQLAPTISVSAEEVKAYYESNKSKYVTKEERRASHILINAAKDAKEADRKAAEEKANQLLAQIRKNPKEFADLAKKHSQDPGSSVAGGDLGFFGRGMMVPAFDKAVFEGKKDELIGPVATDYGFHIIRITDIKPEKGKSLADATPEIEGELKKSKASRKFAELGEKFSNAAFEQSSSLKAAAEVAGLPIKQSAFFAKGQAFQPPFSNPKLSAALFSDEVLKNKRNTEAIDIGNSTLVVARVLESKPAVVRPFSELQVSLIQRLAREEAVKLAKQDGEEKLKLLKDGKDAGVNFPALLAVSRTNPGGLQPSVIDAAMRASPKALPAFVGVAEPSGAYALVKVAKVLESGAPDESKLATTRSRLQQSASQKELLSLIAQLRTDVGVSIAKNALEKKVEK
jgi:peptidyl-prolyl cis-trans isomerase D